MTRNLSWWLVLAIACAAAIGAPTTSEGAHKPAPIAVESLAGTQLSVSPSISYEVARLKVVGPREFAIRESFEAGRPVSVDLTRAAGEALADGRYLYEVRFLTGKGRETRVHSGSFFVEAGAAISRDAKRAQIESVRQGLLAEVPEPILTPDPAEPVPAVSVDDRIFIEDFVKDGETYLSMSSYQGPTIFDVNAVYLGDDNGAFTISYLETGNFVVEERARFRFFAYDPDPYLGLGTTAPSGSIEIASPTAPEVFLTNTYTGDYVEIEHDNERLRIGINGSTRFSIYNSAGADSIVLAENRVDLNGDVRVPNGDISTAGLLLASSRELKQEIRKVDGEEILSRLTGVPVVEWSFKADPEVRHIGPVSEDFHAAFALEGQSDTHLSVIDLQGVAIAAIQALNLRVGELQAERERMETEQGRLRAEVAELRALLLEERP